MRLLHLLRSCICLLALIGLGCGKQTYEQKMTQRIAQLRAGAGAGGGDWSVFESPSGQFVLDLPQPVSTENNQGVEKSVASAGPVTYEVYFRATGAPADLTQAAQGAEQMYTSVGYTVDARNNTLLADQAAIELRLQKGGETPETARLRVAVLGGQNVCILVARGSGGQLPDSDADRFFDSFQLR